MFDRRAPSYLRVYEWWAVVAVLGVIAVFISVSYFLRSHQDFPETKKNHHLRNPFIEVAIQGAVEKPGTYSFPRGATVGDLFEKVKPFHYANISRWKKGTKLREGRLLTIRSFPTIEVWLSGEVIKVGPIKIRKGSKYEDLKNLNIFTDQADLSFLQNSKKMKDGEKIKIPKIVEKY